MKYLILLSIIVVLLLSVTDARDSSHSSSSGSKSKTKVKVHEVEKLVENQLRVATTCNCTDNGLYCGSAVPSSVGGMCGGLLANGLYSCVTRGQAPLLKETCTNGCQINPDGILDTCVAQDKSCVCPDNADHCGSTLKASNNDCFYLADDALYQCQAGYYPIHRWQCPNGCKINGAKLNDTCDRGESNVVGLTKVKHIIIFMQENRAFDHYFGTMKGVCGYNDPSPLKTSVGNSIFYQPDPNSPDSKNGQTYTLPFEITGPKAGCTLGGSNTWGPNHDGWNNGTMDNWPLGNTPASMGYLTRKQLPFYFELADQFTILDQYFSTVMTSTNPNRLVLWTGSIDARHETSPGPVIDNTETVPFTWLTYPEVLEKAGITWRVYQGVDNFDDNALEWFKQFQNLSKDDPMYINGVSNWGIEAFLKDALDGNLPQVTWVVGPQELSEHPDNGPMAGQWLSQQIIQAVVNSSHWEETVLIMDYDEPGGFFDHFAPPVAPFGTLDEWVNLNGTVAPVGSGLRVPSFMISPWSTGGHVYSEPTDHTSVIMFVEQWAIANGFEPEDVMHPLISTYRRNFFSDYTRSLDFSWANSSVPDLPAIPVPSRNVNGTWDPTQECEGIPGAFPVVPYGNQTYPPVETGFRPVRGSNPGQGRIYVFEMKSQTGWAIEALSSQIFMSQMPPTLNQQSQYFLQVPSTSKQGYDIMTYPKQLMYQMCLTGKGVLVDCTQGSHNTWYIIDQTNGQGSVLYNIQNQKYLTYTLRNGFDLVAQPQVSFNIFSVTV
ncbi:non-hemolytic phospholipase C precursor [Cavenderia fasciculata]|uniref:Non-hemolytic phospholipase C n=1 Tax=Cavenderia fasciculata TaxID=261658 RepID=F4PTX0_CACFS|nr:non-hemolytic phospholipase C precursor [Cavenderia fasciculata]EGG20949.1 non-hemolytic phospholipase C precursor [Cavenderia fasciculata]|eukprot:XP_004358799.1 non-hemolytic phospholipase C precursor [Cavenderia fasciculata]